MQPTRRWRAKQQATQTYKPDTASPRLKIDDRRDDLSTSQAVSDLAILKHLFVPDRTGITVSQAWLTAPATVAFTWLDKVTGMRSARPAAR